MLTVFIRETTLRIDDHLLLQQAAALGRILGPPAMTQNPRDAALLEGIWHMLHEILDIAQATPNPATVH